MIIYLICINILTFIFYSVDKFLAINKYYRISEKLLLTFSALGGALGAFFAMILFKHKTLKIKFYFFNIIFILIWLFLIIYNYCLT